MEEPSGQPAMNQKIFDMGLSTEAVSLYLLCCHLQDTRTTISKKNISGLWNGTKEALSQGIENLEKRQILSCTLSADGGNAVYQLNGTRQWKI